MSHYFQQLLTSSGLVPPATIAATPAVSPDTAVDFSEVTEEIVAPSSASTLAPEPASPITAEATPIASEASSLQSPSKLPVPQEPGVIEITSIQSESTRPQPLSPRSPQPLPASTPSIAPTSSTPPPAVSEQHITIEKPASLPPQKETSPRTSEVVAPAAEKKTPPLPSREELIEHVFRWVGQNPSEVEPPALKPRAPQPKPTPTPAANAPATPSPTPASSPAAPLAAPIVAPTPISPSRPRLQPTRHEPALIAQESSVEISIGTLQVHVEAPPAPAPKKASRPPAARQTAASSSSLPAPARPAVDLNRLRRGFYL